MTQAGTFEPQFIGTAWNRRAPGPKVAPSSLMDGPVVKPANFNTLLDDIRDACLAVLAAFVRVARCIATLPWPALLICAFMLALAITLIPVALTLFVLFLAIKLAVGLIVVDKQRRRRN